VKQWPGPSAALETAPAVLIRSAESLHHSIDRDVRDGRQFHGDGSFLFGRGSDLRRERHDII
jgi:hypothetical protein